MTWRGWSRPWFRISVVLILDDTYDVKSYAIAEPMSACLAQIFYVRSEGAYLAALQLVVIAVKDLKTGAVYPVHVEVYVS